jgi:hypothetical protein
MITKLIIYETLIYFSDHTVDRGLIRFYWDYITLRIRYGYENHPMEIEAREASK